MRISKTAMDGLYTLNGNFHEDLRGKFFKFFDSTDFEQHNLETSFKEVFVSTSKKNTIRGMHFQIPPHDQVKLVTVTQGKILDLVLDLRNWSPTHGKYECFTLSDSEPTTLYIAKGLAHGFLALSDNSTVCYIVSEVYNKNSDSGIRWDSFGYDWKVDSPILSERDRNFPSFAEFKSPFNYTNSIQEV